MRSPKIPKEDPVIGQLRDRQVADLAKLDEDENQKLKAAFVQRRGVRAFRRTGSGTGSAGAAGGGAAPVARIDRAQNRAFGRGG
jgi:hypothetical protein